MKRLLEIVKGLMTTKPIEEPQPTDESLLAEYQVCSDKINASANRLWLAATLFIGGAITGLALLLTSEHAMQAASLPYIVGGVVALLLALKWHLYNEEHRQRICHVRMCEIEGQLRLKVSHAIYSPRQTPSNKPQKCWWGLLWWILRFPNPLIDFCFKLLHWARTSNGAELWLDSHKDEIESRAPFGWDFLHFAAWLAIVLWIVAIFFA